jgi:hypothetical protein
VATRSNLHLDLCANAHAAAFDAVVTTMYRLIGLAVIIVWIAGLDPTPLYARDDGRFTNSPLKEWFDRLASRSGLCCAFADGVSVQDVDWDSQEGHYRVRLRLGGLVIGAGSLFASTRNKLAALTVQHAVPAIHLKGDLARCSEKPNVFLAIQNP